MIGTTVTLSEYATASEGMLHGLPLCDSGKERALLAGIGGPPKVPLALRVSTMRHGGRVTNCNADGHRIHDLNVRAIAGRVVTVAGVRGDDRVGPDRQT